MATCRNQKEYIDMVLMLLLRLAFAAD